VTPAEPNVPEVEFVAYAEDCILSGQLRLGAERVSDLLNDNAEFEFVDVLVEDLAGGQAIEIREMSVRRDELLIVHATGPRGNAGRRRRTRQYPIVANTGPYEVRGYVHALPGSDPIASLRRRKPMIALTDAVIHYTTGSVPQRRRAAVVILNRDCVDWIVGGGRGHADRRYACRHERPLAQRLHRGRPPPVAASSASTTPGTHSAATVMTVPTSVLGRGPLTQPCEQGGSVGGGLERRSEAP
jgi:hypothetical protein